MTLIRFNNKLIGAITNRDIYSVKKLVKSFDINAIDYDNFYSYEEYTALMMASYNGYNKIVKILLEFGADPNIQNKNGWTALMDTTVNENYKITRKLLKAGADYSIENNSLEDALTIAIEKRSFKVAKILTRHIILVPFMSRRFKKINKDIIREVSLYI
jgi:ankyrin repeat protein